MKTALKRKNNKVLIMPLKHILGVMSLVDHPRTPKLWAIAHKNGHKCKNSKKKSPFLSKMSKPYIPCKSPWNPKQWAIAHEDGPKTQKRRVLGHASQTCTECHGPCKSLQNPKTMDNSS
jgi:hypothetical protein